MLMRRLENINSRSCPVCEDHVFYALNEHLTFSITHKKDDDLNTNCMRLGSHDLM